MAALIEDEEFATSELAFLPVQTQSLAQPQLGSRLPIRPPLPDAAIMAYEGAPIFPPDKRLRRPKGLGLTGMETSSLDGSFSRVLFFVL
jgi:hypothetical protein